MVKTNSTVFLSIVIPSYNEAVNFQRGCLNDILPFLEQQDFIYELILSDDGSTDHTPKLLQDFIVRSQPQLTHGTIKFITNPHGGKVVAIHHGMKIAQGTWCLFTDFDQSIHISELSKLLRFTKQDYAIIFGSRKIHPQQNHTKLSRKFISNTFSLITHVITGLTIKDTQCGFKLFNRQGITLFDQLYIYNPNTILQHNKTHPKLQAFTGAFDVELFLIAKAQKLKVKEVSIKCQHYPTKRVHIIKDSFHMLCDIIKIRQAIKQNHYQPQTQPKSSH